MGLSSLWAGLRHARACGACPVHAWRRADHACLWLRDHSDFAWLWSRREFLSPKLRGRLQSVAAILLMLFAVQTVLRGLAVANVIPSFSYGQVMLW